MLGEPWSQLGGPQSQLGGPRSQLGGPQSQLGGPQSQVGGPRGGWMIERANKWKDGKSPHSTGLRPLPGPLPKNVYNTISWKDLDPNTCL